MASSLWGEVQNIFSPLVIDLEEAVFVADNLLQGLVQKSLQNDIFTPYFNQGTLRIECPPTQNLLWHLSRKPLILRNATEGIPPIATCRA